MFIPLRNYTHYSILSSIQTPEGLAKQAKLAGYDSCAITDIDSVGGSVEFYQACKKNDIKPIFGAEIDVNNQGKLCFIAQNKDGWRELLNLISISNSDSRWIGVSSLKIEDIFNTKNLIVIDGFEGSLYKNKENNYLSDLNNNISNYFLTIEDFQSQESEKENKLTREIASELNIPIVATSLSLYSDKENYEDYRLISCIKNSCTLKNPRIFNETDKKRFYSNKYCLHTLNSIPNNFSKDEFLNCKLIEDLCDDIDITENPKLPQFVCPDGLSEIDYLKQIAREGYKKKSKNWDRELYGNRAKMELSIIEKTGLAGYFLIVRDYVEFAKNAKMLVGPGRGSAAGCLISYLIGITNIDPIPFNLLFERFYNDGRNSPGKISYPDVDTDFPPSGREKVISYIRNKYGENNVAQIATFGRLQGRSAIREVLRVHESCDMNTINLISKTFPQEGQISDKLEEADEKSIINWTLDNEPERIESWCRKDEKGELSGDLADFFKQAIRIEGIIKSVGKHAAGIIISSENLNYCCPMIRDKGSDNKIIGLEKDSLEKIGLIKFDLLGVSVLEKLSTVRDMLRGNYD